MLRSDELSTRDQAECVAWTPAQRAAILAEANDILAHPSFKNSKRCITLFRRLIDHALDGDQEGVKERTLGIEVFSREPDYDTSADPIVRMTANEIRKRLAQYYQASNRRSELKISLVPGTYLPQFEFDTADNLSAGAEADFPEPVRNPVPFPGPVVVEDSRTAERAPARRAWILWSAAGVVLAAVALLLAHSNVFRSTQDLLWAPLLNSSEPVTVCIPDLNINDAGDPNWAEAVAKTIAEHEIQEKPTTKYVPPVVQFSDADVAARLTGWLWAHNKRPEIRRASSMTLEDLRHGPVVLIGAFSNSWNLVLLSNLRYRVRVDPVTLDEWVEDSQNLSRRDWKGSGKLLFSDTSVDYAIVTRVLDADTGNWILAVGALGLHGTEAAGELLTGQAFAKGLPAVLRSSMKNFQIVLKTTVIDGHTGPPQIVAVYTW